MKHKTPRTIDVTDAVLKRVGQGGVRMLSKKQLIARKLFLVGSFLLVALISCLGFMSLIYIAQHDVFTEYRQLGFNPSLFVQSLPWPGIITTLSAVVLGTALAIQVHRRTRPNLRLSYMLGVWLVLLGAFSVLAVNLSDTKTPSIIARLGYLSNKDPIKISGIITAKYDDHSASVKVGDTVYVVEGDFSGLAQGDTILIFGNEVNGKINAIVINLLTKAPEKITLAEKKEINIKSIKEKDEPMAPKIESKPESKPEPAQKEQTQTITYSVTPIPNASNPDKYLIQWTSNFNTVTGWKLPYTTSPGTPSYPGSSYQYIPDEGASSGQAKFYKTDLGTGTFNIRICAYNTSAEIKCPVYSSIISIVFYP